MSSNTAVVETETEGAKSLIDDNISGRLVQIDNPVGISEAVCEILGHPEKTKALENSAKSFAMKRFSIDKMISSTERVYEEVLDR